MLTNSFAGGVVLFPDFDGVVDELIEAAQGELTGRSRVVEAVTQERGLFLHVLDRSRLVVDGWRGNRCLERPQSCLSICGPLLPVLNVFVLTVVNLSILYDLLSDSGKLGPIKVASLLDVGVVPLLPHIGG